jgi:hypothetical protein
LKQSGLVELMKSILIGAAPCNLQTPQISKFREFFSHPIAYQRPLATITGSVKAAVLLSQFLYWTRVMSEKAQREGREWDGWFYKTQEQIEAETGLSSRSQKTIRTICVRLGILEEHKRAVPAKLHYRLNLDVLARLLAAVCESAKLVLQKRETLIGTEITAESTTLCDEPLTTQEASGGSTSEIPNNSKPLFDALISLRVRPAAARKWVCEQPEGVRLALKAAAANPKHFADDEALGGKLHHAVFNPERYRRWWSKSESAEAAPVPILTDAARDFLRQALDYDPQRTEALSRTPEQVDAWGTLWASWTFEQRDSVRPRLNVPGADIAAVMACEHGQGT